MLNMPKVKSTVIGRRFTIKFLLLFIAAGHKSSSEEWTDTVKKILEQFKDDETAQTVLLLDVTENIYSNYGQRIVCFLQGENYDMQ